MPRHQVRAEVGHGHQAPAGGEGEEDQDDECVEESDQGMLAEEAQELAAPDGKGVPDEDAWTTRMVAAKANASEDVVPEFVGDLVPFDKARVSYQRVLVAGRRNSEDDEVKARCHYHHGKRSSSTPHIMLALVKSMMISEC